MIALAATLVVWLFVSSPALIAGIWIGRRLEREKQNRRIERAHPRPWLVYDAEQAGDYPLLGLAGKPAFGDRAAGDVGCFDDHGWGA